MINKLYSFYKILSAPIFCLVHRGVIRYSHGMNPRVWILSDWYHNWKVHTSSSALHHLLVSYASLRFKKRTFLKFGQNKHLWEVLFSLFNAEKNAVKSRRLLVELYVGHASSQKQSQKWFVRSKGNDFISITNRAQDFRKFWRTWTATVNWWTIEAHKSWVCKTIEGYSAIYFGSNQSIGTYTRGEDLSTIQIKFEGCQEATVHAQSYAWMPEKRFLYID